MKAAAAFALAFSALLIIGQPDYDAAVTTENIVTDTHVIVSRLDAPRCPKANAARAQLAFEIAERGDDREWTITCIYEEQHQ